MRLNISDPTGTREHSEASNKMGNYLRAEFKQFIHNQSPSTTRSAMNKNDELMKSYEKNFKKVS